MMRPGPRTSTVLRRERGHGDVPPRRPEPRHNQGPGGRGPTGHYCTANVATPVTSRVPSVQETVAVAAPGVRVAGVQLHVTVPALSASFSPCKDRLPDVWPEA